VVTVAVVWFNFVNPYPASSFRQSLLDLVDGRPAERILVIGNSRTFYNDMPAMVRKIADSADAPVKYQLVVHAVPAETLEGHWNNRHVQSLLDDEWDTVIIQAESAAHVGANSERFLDYGGRLVDKAKVGGANPKLLVTWVYGAQLLHRSGLDDGYYRQIQQDHAQLAREAGAELINAGAIWRAFDNADLPFALYTDGNHPSLSGSYLTGLVVYMHLSGNSAENVTWGPDGMSEADAAALREHASYYARLRGGV
jgi:hypothetical protein